MTGSSSAMSSEYVSSSVDGGAPGGDLPGFAGDLGDLGGDFGGDLGPFDDGDLGAFGDGLGFVGDGFFALRSSIPSSS